MIQASGRYNRSENYAQTCNYNLMTQLVAAALHRKYGWQDANIANVDVNNDNGSIYIHDVSVQHTGVTRTDPLLSVRQAKVTQPHGASGPPRCLRFLAGLEKFVSGHYRHSS